MLYVLNFKIGVAHISIHFYRFLMHQTLKMKLPTQSLLRKKINAQLLDHLNDPELFELLRHANCMLTLKVAENATRMNIASLMANVLLRRQILQKHLFLTFASIKSKIHY